MKRSTHGLLALPIIGLIAFAVLMVPSGAGAHGGGTETFGEVVEGSDGRFVVGYGRFRTNRTHHRLYVRVCLQEYVEGEWRRRKCAADVVFKRRDHTHVVTYDCDDDGFYRVRVRGWIMTSDDEIRHRKGLTTASYGVACD